MDPYLESPSVFGSLHDSLIVHLMEDLQRRLPEPYFAQTREHVWLEVEERHVEPDVSLMRPATAPQHRQGHGAAMAVASLPRIAPVVVAVPTIEYRELSLEVYGRQDSGFRLVTAIEVLSLTNKRQGSERREDYLEKQKELLNQNVHLVEIDLLRGGAHTTAVPRARALKAAGAFDYHACVHRFDRRGEFLVYAFRLQDPLPEVDLPLLPGDGAVRVDLQALFNGAYDGGPYRRRIRYGQDEVVPPLAPREAEWAEEVVAKLGKGSGAGRS
jgi:hypothetical protein